MAENNSKKIGLGTATITGMNAMIGAGIFAAPAVLATHVGPAGILAYIFVVISVWFVAQSLSRVAQLFPQEGAFYTYTKQWGGHTMGLIANASYLIGILTAMGLLAKMSGQFLQYFFPTMSAHSLGLIALGIIVLINVLGVSMSQLGQRILICCTIFPILATIVMCLSKANLSFLTPFAPFGFGNVIKATSVVIFGFFGFESAASLFNVVKNPERNVPKALTYSILLVGALYIVFIGSIILSTPLSSFTASKTPLLPDILKITFPNHPWLISIVSISIVSAILGTIHSVVWGASSLMLSFFKKIKAPVIKNLITKKILNKKVSVILTGLTISASYLLIQKDDLFFNFAAIFIVFAYVASITTLLFIKEEWKSKQNIKTILGIVTASIIFAFAVQGVVAELTKLTQ
ncbi:APC family permease [Candidatus Dependentiae bacterium]